MYRLRQSSDMDDDPPSYTSAVAAAAALDLSDASLSNAIHLSPVRDQAGLPILVLNPHALSAPFPLAWSYFLATFSSTTASPYRLLVVASGAFGLVAALRAARCAAALPAARRKNLAAISLVHPGVVARAFVWGGSVFMSEKLWEKMQMVDRVEELVLDGVVGQDDLKELLPEVCWWREKEIEKEGERAREIARVQGLTGTEESGASGGDVGREDLVAAAAETRASD